MPRPLLSTARTLIALTPLTLAFGSPSSAAQAPPACGGNYQTYEVRLVTTDPNATTVVRITAADGDDEVYGSGYAPPGGVIETFNTSYTNGDAPFRGNPGPYLFEIRFCPGKKCDFEEPGETFYYTYYESPLAAWLGHEFFAPGIPPSPHPDADFCLAYLGPGRMRAIPKELNDEFAAHPSYDGVEDVFGGGPWVLPYDDELLCAGLGAPFPCHGRRYLLAPGRGYPHGEGYTFAAGAPLTNPAGYTWDWDGDDTGVLRFPQSRRLVVEGVLNVTGTTLTAVNTSQRWGGLRTQGTGRVTLTEATVDWATTGLDVRSTGNVVQGSTFASNGTGVRSDLVSSGVRSGFTLTRSPATGRRTVVTGSTTTGVYALNTNADISYTDLTGNGDAGLRVANAFVELTRENTVTGNGAATDGYGVSVLTGGNFRLSPQGARGQNRVAGNATTEVWVFDGGLAFFGNAFTNGFNSVYDLAGGRLVRYPLGSSLPAKYTWWGSSAGPNLATAFFGPVTYCPHLTCDPTTNPSCSQFGCGSSLRAGGSGGDAPAALAGSSTAALRGAVGADSTATDFLDGLRAEILQTRAALAADAAGPGADTLVASLAALHRLDLEDATGEWAATALLFAVLRAPLGDAALPDDGQAAGEAALVAEAVLGLEREDYTGAAALLVGDGGLAEGAGAVRQLALVEAFRAAMEGRRAEASALVAGLAAAAVDPEEARELAALAAALGDDLEGATPDPAPDPGAEASATLGVATEAGAAGMALSVVPNPAHGAATVMLALPQPSGVDLRVFDVLGRAVALLSDGRFEAGTHRLALDGAALPPGVYVVRAVVEPAGGLPRTLAHRFTVLR